MVKRLESEMKRLEYEIARLISENDKLKLTKSEGSSSEELIKLQQLESIKQFIMKGSAVREQFTNSKKIKVSNFNWCPN